MSAFEGSIVTKQDQKTVVVIDGNSLLHRAFHAIPPTMTTPDGRPSNAAFGFMSMLIKIVEEYTPGAIVCAFDKGKPIFRIEALKRYKSQRPPTDPLLKEQFPLIKKLLVAMDIPVVEEEGWEGDDILGTLAKQGSDAQMRMLLVTGDRDAFQLVDDNVSVVTTRKGISDVVIYTPELVEERYGIPPSLVPDYLGLKGDPSDNIPGVKGVGEKTATKLLQEYGTLEGVVDHSDEIKGKLGENIREHVDEAFLSRTVATIARDVPIDCDLSKIEFPSFDVDTVREAFHEVSFRAQLAKVLSFAGEQGPDDVSAPDALSVPKPVSGEEATALVAQACEQGEWMGAAYDDGTATSLFGEEALYVATSGGIAVFEGASNVDRGLKKIFLEGNVASLDVKSLAQRVIPADSACTETISYTQMDPKRYFDIGVAAYLMDSSRSAYDEVVLADQYLGQTLPPLGDDLPAGLRTAALARPLRESLLDDLHKDGSWDCFARIEMPLLRVLVQMERVGVGLDTNTLDDLLMTTNSSIDKLREEIFDLAGEEFTIDSPKQLAEILFVKMGLPPKKRTKTGFSTDASVLSELAEIHPIAEKIVAYREFTKLRSTYIEALPKLLKEDGRLHTSYNQTVAATGRLSSSNPNLQNIPARTDFGRRIRAAFVADSEEDTMISADYSQIELRVLAHLSQDPGLIEAFTQGEDFHAETAARTFGVPVDQVTTAMRAKAKAVNFGIIYGQQAYGLSQSLKIPFGEAQETIDNYYRAYPKVRTYLDHLVEEAHRNGYAVTMWGRKRHIPELLSRNPNVRSFGERTAMNHPMQGSAADIIKLAMISVQDLLESEGFSARMVLQVHDELLFECPKTEATRLAALVEAAMDAVAPQMAVPLEVSVAIAQSWAEAK